MSHERQKYRKMYGVYHWKNWGQMEMLIVESHMHVYYFILHFASQATVFPSTFHLRSFACKVGSLVTEPGPTRHAD